MCLNALAMHILRCSIYCSYDLSFFIPKNGHARHCSTNLDMHAHALAVRSPTVHHRPTTPKRQPGHQRAVSHSAAQTWRGLSRWCKVIWMNMGVSQQNAPETCTNINPQTGFWMVLVSPKHLRPFASRFCTDKFQPSTVLLTLALLDQWPGSTEQENHRDLLSMFDFMFLYGKNHATKTYCCRPVCIICKNFTCQL